MYFEHLKVSTLLLGSAGPGPADEVLGGGGREVLDTVPQGDVDQPSTHTWIGSCAVAWMGKVGGGRDQEFGFQYDGD